MPASRITRWLLPESIQGRIPRAHLIGICGSGMKALAEVLADDAWQLTGSDATADPNTVEQLKRLGVQVVTGHDPDNVPADADLVIYSPAVPELNPERRRAKELQVPQISYVDALRRISHTRRLICVAGTHGKSTTTHITARLLEAGGLAPTFLSGAQRLLDNRNGRLGQLNDITVLEACEYQRHFLQLQPDMIGLLGIEPDHFDCFSTFDAAIEAYEQFVQSLPHDGILIYNADCRTSASVALKCPGSSMAFSLIDDQIGWHASITSGRLSVIFKGKEILTVDRPSAARHELQNLLAAVAMSGMFLGFDFSKKAVQKVLTEPPKLKRRFEVIQESPHRTIIDDYAHHPTEIRATLKLARIRYPDKKITCCFQPHQLSRTQNLREEFTDALALADRVYLLPVFGARETASDEHHLESERLTEKLQQKKVAARFVSSLDQLRRTLETDALSHEVILTMGAGDIARIHNERT